MNSQPRIFSSPPSIPSIALMEVGTWRIDGTQECEIELQCGLSPLRAEVPPPDLNEPEKFPRRFQHYLHLTNVLHEDV